MMKPVSQNTTPLTHPATPVVDALKPNNTSGNSGAGASMWPWHDNFHKSAAVAETVGFCAGAAAVCLPLVFVGLPVANAQTHECARHACANNFGFYPSADACFAACDGLNWAMSYTGPCSDVRNTMTAIIVGSVVGGLAAGATLALGAGYVYLALYGRNAKGTPVVP